MNCKLKGMAICRAELTDGSETVVSTYILVEAEKENTYCEGVLVDTSYSEPKYIEACYPDEYKVFDVEGNVTEGQQEIEKIIEIIKDELEEID